MQFQLQSSYINRFCIRASTVSSLAAATLDKKNCSTSKLIHTHSSFHYFCLSSSCATFSAFL